MILRENNNIIKLLEDIQQYKHKDRNKLFENYEAYYLQYKNELRLLRNVNALRKKNDL